MKKEEEKLIKKEKLITKILVTLTLIISIAVSFIVTVIIEESQKVVTTAAKPIIYLYPEEETEITVKLGYPEKVTTIYPKYEKESMDGIQRIR